MYRNYAEYEKHFDDMQKNGPQAVRGKLKKKTPEQFEVENYRDKVEFYLAEEWDTGWFHDIFCTEENMSDEMTPEEKRLLELYEKVYDIIFSGLERNDCIPNVARKVLVFLQKENVLKSTNS